MKIMAAPQPTPGTGKGKILAAYAAIGPVQAKVVVPSVCH